jgi:integrase
VEIRDLWQGLESSAIELRYQLAIKLLLATGGQRVIEVVEAHWKEFDTERRIWELPPSRAKNGRGHIVPLSDLAVSLLDKLRATSDGNSLLFPKKPGATEPVSLSMISYSISSLFNSQEFEKFTARDIRRTCKTRMGEIGLSKEIRDRIHNHALTDVSSKHYDRYDYLEEKRIAMKAWNDYLTRIVGGDDTNVVEIKRA